MIKFTIAYPYSEGSRFDHAYYKDGHIPLVTERFGAACLRVEIDRGISGFAPESPPAFHALAHFHFESMDGFRAAIAPHMGALAQDVPNYTDVAPVIQLSEAVDPRD